MCITNIKSTERSQHQGIRTIRFYFYEEQKSRKNKSTLLLVKTVITPGGWVVIRQGHRGCSWASHEVLFLDLGVVTQVCSGHENSLSCRLFKEQIPI